jgi:hypothetical protein
MNTNEAVRNAGSLNNKIETCRNTLLESIADWAEDSTIKDSLYPYDDWNPLLIAASIGDIELLKILLGNGANVNFQNSSSSIIPQVSALHIVVKSCIIEAINLLLSQPDILVNIQDQWGFIPLHYAVLSRSKEVVLLLLNNGALANIESKDGSTALDISKELKYDDITDIIASKTTTENDPTLPKFREWLCSLGAGEYLPNFISAGYDLPFISKHGMIDADLDCVGIPLSKLGIRRKIMAMHNLANFYEEDDDDEEEDDEEDDDEEEDEEDDDEEEEED